MFLRIKRKRFNIILSHYVGNSFALIKGPLGKLSLTLPKFLILKKKKIFSSKMYLNSFSTSMYNTIRSLIFGHYAQILTEGVGFRFHRFDSDPQLLCLNLGHSHAIYLKMPKTLFFRCQKYNLFLFSLNKTLLNTFALLIKQLRFPDAYKGKGLRFASDILKFKPGKIRQR